MKKSLDSEIKFLERKLKVLKTKKKRLKAKNKEKVKTADRFSSELLGRATDAEIKFGKIAKLKGLELEFQKPIYIRNGSGEITKFFIADYLDPLRKIIFEIDGEYHDSELQTMLDEERTRILHRRGYGVYRISNSDVMNGKTTQFLYKVYKGIGLDILAHN